MTGVAGMSDDGGSWLAGSEGALSPTAMPRSSAFLRGGHDRTASEDGDGLGPGCDGDELADWIVSIPSLIIVWVGSWIGRLGNPEAADQRRPPKPSCPSASRDAGDQAKPATNGHLRE